MISQRITIAFGSSRLRKCPIHCQWTRGMASNASSPSSKITTTPFQVTPTEALNKMHINALLASASVPNMVYAFLLRLFGPSVTSLAREFGFGSKLELKGQMKAALYPIWRVDSMIEGKLKLANAKDTRLEPNLWICCKEAYVPGNPFAPLSYLSFAVPPLPDNLPAYNPSKDLRQLENDGLEVVPVPFTVSPLGLLRRIRKSIGKRSEWENLIANESKFKETLVACYPIMFPVYIAEFEYEQGEGERRLITVVMDAHDENIKNCRVSWPPPPHLVESGRFDKNYYVNPAPFMPNLNVALYPLPAPHALLGTPHAKLIETYDTYMSPAPTVGDISDIDPSPMVAVQQYEESDGVDWEDERIQSWSGVEREENAGWMEMTSKVQKGLETIETMHYLSTKADRPEQLKGIVISTGLGRPHFERKSLTDMEDQLRKDLEKMKEELEETKPNWLRKWEVKDIQGKLEGAKKSQ
ncbi:hypothetical protein L204_100089 [Cryptococcus depauperatus]|nr:hypothetical protein L204_02430 [Cryptococcus depauperatus CBS 7855]